MTDKDNTDLLTGEEVTTEHVMSIANTLIEACQHYCNDNPDVSNIELLGGICMLLAMNTTKPGYPAEQSSHNLSICMETLINMSNLIRAGYVTFYKVPDNYDK